MNAPTIQENPMAAASFETEKKNIFGSRYTFTFLNQTFAKWEDCSLQCSESVGGRIPSVVTKEQWNALVNFLSESHNDTSSLIDGLILL